MSKLQDRDKSIDRTQISQAKCGKSRHSKKTSSQESQVKEVDAQESVMQDQHGLRRLDHFVFGHRFVLPLCDGSPDLWDGEPLPPETVRDAAGVSHAPARLAQGGVVCGPHRPSTSTTSDHGKDRMVVNTTRPRMPALCNVSEAPYCVPCESPGNV